MSRKVMDRVQPDETIKGLLLASGCVAIKNGLVYVNRDGKIYGAYKNGAIKELIPFKKNKGYYAVYVEGKQYLAHNLIAEGFIENWDEEGYYISFKNDNKEDWSLDNLVKISNEQLTVKRRTKKTKNKEWLQENGFVNVIDGVFIDKTGDIYRAGKQYNWAYYYQGNFMEHPMKKVSVFNEGTLSYKTAAYLYALAFVENPENYKYVAFEDAAKERTLNNIVWTKNKSKLSYETLDKRAMEAASIYEGYKKAGLPKNTVLYIERRIEGMTLKQIGDMYGVTKQSVSECLNNAKNTLAIKRSMDSRESK